MILHIANVGIYANERIDHVLIRRGADKVILVYTEVNRKEVSQIREKLKEYLIPVDLVYVEPFDYEQVLSRILEEIAKHSDYRVEFNVSCGTRIMTAASCMAAVLVGSPVHFVCQDGDELPGKLVTVHPLPRAMLTKPKKNILDRLVELGGTVNSQAELGTRVGLGVASISKHIKDLEQFNYVKRNKEKGKNKVVITDLGRVILQLKQARKERLWGP